jgi:acetyl esterase/lipase
MKKIAIILIPIVFLLVSPFASRGVLAVAVMHDILSSDQKNSWTARISKAPIEQHPTILLGNAQMGSNLYIPSGNSKHAIIVYIHGISPLGKDDPRLDYLARTFSRAGFVVLVPELPDMSPDKLSPDVIGEIEASIQYAYSRSDIVSDKKVGVFGFSIGSGPALIAISRLKPKVPIRFIISFGGYYDLREVITFSTTGKFAYRGQGYFLEPDNQTRWYFVQYYSDYIQNPNDTQILKNIAQAKLADSNTDVSSLVGQLSSEGKAAYDVTANTDPSKAGMLLDNLPDQLKSLINSLDPTEQIQNISGNLYIIHSTNDNVVPYTQSLELYDYFKNKTPSQLVLLSIFSHVNPMLPQLTLANIFTGYIAEFLKFWKLIYELLGYRS